MMERSTIDAAELAETLGVSRWLIYESIREGTCPIEPIRIGRRLVFSRAKLDELLGADGADSLDQQSTSDHESAVQRGYVNQKSTRSADPETKDQA